MQVNAQKKKAVISKSNIAQSTIPYLNKDIDEVLNWINDKFSANGFIFKSVDESLDYVYDDSLKKTDKLFHHFRTLILDKEMVIHLMADAQKNTLQVTVSGIAEPQTIPKLEAIFGLQTWENVETKGNIRIKKKNNSFTYIEQGETYFSIDIFLAAKLPENISIIKTDSLQITNSWNEVIHSVVQRMKSNNQKLLYAKEKLVWNDSEYNFNGYEQTLQFANGIQVNFNQNESKQTSVKISCNNPITYNALKKIFVKETFPLRYNYFETNVYRTGNVLFSDDANTKTLKLEIVPDFDDDKQKQKYNVVPDLYLLKDYHNAFAKNPEKLQLFLADHFKVNNDGQIEIQSKAGDYKVYFAYDTNNDTFWGLKLVIDYNNANIGTWYKNQSENAELPYQDFNMKTFSRTQFYDKIIYNAYKTSGEMKDKAQKIADAKREAEQKLRQIEEDRRKAQRNAELQDAINQTTNELLKLLK